MKIHYEDKYFLVSFEYDHSWSCVSIEAFRTGKVRNLDKNNNTAEIHFNKSWYLCRIHSSANDIESILSIMSFNFHSAFHSISFLFVSISDSNQTNTDYEFNALRI